MVGGKNAWVRACGSMGVYSLNGAEFHSTLKKRIVDGLRDRWVRVGLTEWGQSGQKPGRWGDA